MDPKTKPSAAPLPVPAAVPEAPPVNVATAMHGRMVAAAASRNALLAARLRVENAKREADRISIHWIEAAATIWSRPKGRRCNRAASAKALKRFISRGINWLRFLGWLDEAEEDHADDCHDQ